MTRDSLGYGVAPADVWRVIARPQREGGVLAYPGYGRLRLFTMAELTAMLRDADLAPVRTWGLHALTNLIPSTVLHRARLPRPLAALYRRLCALDDALSGFWPAPRLANSIVVLARKFPEPGGW